MFSIITTYNPIPAYVIAFILYIMLFPLTKLQPIQFAV